MTISDADAVAALSGQLGYPLSADIIRERISVVSTNAEHAALMAEDDGGHPLGWIHVFVAHFVESPNSYVEIGGLVVDENARGLGVGRALVLAVEQWAIEHGFDDIRVRSASRRTEAHAFYEHLGYEVQKTQLRFVKKLPPQF